MWKFIAKLAIAGAVLWYVFASLDVEEIFSHIKGCNPLYLLCAFISLLASTYVSSLRLGIYLKLRPADSARLYYAGMLFNTVLPGGISGDGYVAYNLKKQHQISYKKGMQILLLNRANGLFFLNLLFYAFLLVSEYAKLPYVEATVFGLFFLQMPVYFIISRKLLGEDWALFRRTALYSLALQILSVTSVVFVFLSLGISSHLVEYISQFIASSIVGIIPITPGGVGVREFVFYKGSKLIDLDAEFAVASSLAYFALYLLISFIGFYYILKGKKHGST